ncbi:MAG: hypothetical protein IH597_11500 [Bacteroidales bacterium]|nr:hypothetical protein [Bacteroidales bacterium]
MDKFNGYLYAMLAEIGSRSEGPAYYLQLLEPQRDITEYPIKKKSELWDIDPVLHAFLARKISIGGELQEGRINYKTIIPYGEELTGELPANEPTISKLSMQLSFVGNTYSAEDQMMWVNKMPQIGGPPPFLNNLKIILDYRWLAVGEYRGSCPTSQFFEFTIHDPNRTLIWEWGKTIKFSNTHNSFELTGNYKYSFNVDWPFFNHAIQHEGDYIVTAKFLATGNILKKTLKVTFVH